MIVRSKKRFGFVWNMMVEEFSNTPRQTDAIKGAGTTSDLIHQNQTACGEIVQNTGSLIHLHHKG